MRTRVEREGGGDTGRAPGGTSAVTETPTIQGDDERLRRAYFTGGRTRVPAARGEAAHAPRSTEGRAPAGRCLALFSEFQDPVGLWPPLSCVGAGSPIPILQRRKLRLPGSRPLSREHSEHTGTKIPSRDSLPKPTPERGAGRLAPTFPEPTAEKGKGARRQLGFPAQDRRAGGAARGAGVGNERPTHWPLELRSQAQGGESQPLPPC